MSGAAPSWAGAAATAARMVRTAAETAALAGVPPGVFARTVGEALGRTPPPGPEPLSLAAARALLAPYRAVSPRQLALLHLIAHRPGLSPTAAARALGISMPSTSRCLDALAAAGLVEARRTAEDRRVATLTLTERGRRILELVGAA